MTNLNSILKSRDITLKKKAHIAKVMVFPVIVYGCESWVFDDDEHLVGHDHRIRGTEASWGPPIHGQSLLNQ